MELKEIKKKDNVFFDRKEIDFSVNEEITPSNAQIRAEIAKKLGVSEEVVVIKRIEQQYGQHEAIAHAFVYNKEDSRKNYEKVKVKKQKAGAPAK